MRRRSRMDCRCGLSYLLRWRRKRRGRWRPRSYSWRTPGETSSSSRIGASTTVRCNRRGPRSSERSATLLLIFISKTGGPMRSWASTPKMQRRASRRRWPPSANVLVDGRWSSWATCWLGVIVGSRRWRRAPRHRCGVLPVLFAQAIYLPAAALFAAEALGCDQKGRSQILGCDTQEAEGYLVEPDGSVSLLRRPR